MDVRRPAATAGRDRGELLDGHDIARAPRLPPRTRVHVPNGADTDRFAPNEQRRREVRAELDIMDDEILVGLVARFDPMKDHATFAYARLHTHLAAGQEEPW